jgi:cobalt-zinc-cadmium efflux system membrane fusion protein
MHVRLWTLTLLVVLCGGCGNGSAPPPAAAVKPTKPEAGAAPETRVELATPEYRVRPTTLETTGKVQFNEEALVRVHAPVTGRVVEVLARPGDVVEPGHPLLSIDSPDLGQAKSDYAKAVTDVERADKALRLAQELVEVKAIAQKEVREAESDYRKAVAERERALSRLRALGVGEGQAADVAARVDTATLLVVRASRGGIIVERNVSPGQVVAYGQSDNPVNLFVIADLGTMWIVADVYEPDIPRVHRDQPVVITLPCCPNERWEGRVSYISDVVDKDSRTVKVRAVVPNRGRILKSEMFVRVAIATGSLRALTVPQSAIHRESGDTFVLVEKAKDEYERRAVKLGADVDGTVEILQGLEPGERVVTTGSILLKRTVK